MKNSQKLRGLKIKTDPQSRLDDKDFVLVKKNKHKNTNLLASEPTKNKNWIYIYLFDP